MSSNIKKEAFVISVVRKWRRGFWGGKGGSSAQEGAGMAEQGVASVVTFTPGSYPAPWPEQLDMGLLNFLPMK